MQTEAGERFEGHAAGQAVADEGRHVEDVSVKSVGAQGPRRARCWAAQWRRRAGSSHGAGLWKRMLTRARLLALQELGEAITYTWELEDKGAGFEEPARACLARPAGRHEPGRASR